MRSVYCLEDVLLCRGGEWVYLGVWVINSLLPDFVQCCFGVAVLMMFVIFALLSLSCRGSSPDEGLT